MLSSSVRARGPRAQAERFMKLKRYQTDTLSMLHRFFEEARTALYPQVQPGRSLSYRLLVRFSLMSLS